jgi:hypothetical protein
MSSASRFKYCAPSQELRFRDLRAWKSVRWALADTRPSDVHVSSFLAALGEWNSDTNCRLRDLFLVLLLSRVQAIFHNRNEGSWYDPIKSVVFSCWSQYLAKIEYSLEDKGIISVHNVYRKRYSPVMQDKLGLSMTVCHVCHTGMHGRAFLDNNTTVREEGRIINSSSEWIRCYRTDDHSMMQTAISPHATIFAKSLRCSIKA